jgi:uncharacterized membrane protein
MPPTASPAASARAPWAKPLVLFGWFVVLSGLAYFVAKNVPRYLVVTEESYGAYFWPKVGWLLPHVIGGVVAAILGPLQFVPKIRRDYLQFHRISGRLYVVMVLIGAVASFGMSARIGGEYAAYGLGLTGLGIAWLVTTGMAFAAIRRKNIVQHKQWMVRSYVVTFAFVTFRLLDDSLRPANLIPEDELSTALAWGCWSIPLVFTELIIQSREVFKKRA